MKYLGIIFILFGVIVIVYPEFLAILIGSFFVFMGVNIFLLWGWISNPFIKKSKKKWEDYVKFWKYKIYR